MRSMMNRSRLSLVMQLLVVLALTASALWFWRPVKATGSGKIEPFNPSANAPVSATGGAWIYGLYSNSGIQSIIPTNDRGYLAAGYTNQNYSSSRSDILLLRLDNAGNTVWEKTLSYTSEGQELVWSPHNVVATSDGAYILGASVETPMVGWHTRVIKFDDTGAILWNKEYQTTVPGRPIFLTSATAATNDGGALIASEVNLTNTNSVDTIYTVLIRLNASGEVLWSKQYGGSDVDHITFSLKPTSDGGFVGSGWNNPRSAGATHSGWVYKIDGSGNLLWSTRLANPFPTGNDDITRDVTETSEGNYLATGIILGQDSPWINKGYVAKLNGSGSILWQKVYGDLNGQVSALTIAATGDGGAVFAGNGATAGMAVRISSAGDVVWSKSYYPGTEQWSMMPTAGGGFVVGGQSEDSSYIKGFVLQMDSNGVVGVLCPLGTAFSLTVTSDSTTAASDNAVVSPGDPVIGTIATPSIDSRVPSIIRLCPFIVCLPLILKP